VALTPHAVLRWVYTGRLSLASAIFVAAAVVSQRTGAGVSDLLVASLAFGVSVVVAGASFAWSEIYRKPLRLGFLYLQTVHDLCLVTAVVHVTGGGASQFAALYILVIAAGALLLPPGRSLLLAAFGNALYFTDVVLFTPAGVGLGVWLQLAVFAVVALGSAWVGARLREAGRDREAVEAELVRYRLQAENILENIRSGILSVDERGQLRFANPAAALLLDLELDRAIGRPILGQIAGRSPALAAALERAVGAGERTTRGEGIVTTPERRFHIGVTTTFTDHGIEGVGTSGRTATAIFSDISDQKRLEALRLRAERLEGIAALSASLAHEIKNPLAAVRSAVEQLAGMPQASDDERTLTSLVVRESDRLSRFLSEFLDFTRVRVRQTAVVDAAAVARGAAALAATHPDCPPGLTVTCSAADGVTFPVQGDEDLLHRAVFNLVLNAMQATPPNGHVGIDVVPAPRGVVPAGLDFPTGAVVLRVTDTGSGIPQDVRDRMFDPFFTTKPGGSGLGLAVVQRAVEAHRGFVTIESPCFDAADGRPAHGSRVSIVLPRAVPTPATPSSTPIVS